MAATKKIEKKVLTIEVDSGKVDTKGQKVYTRKSFSNVKPDADESKVMDVAKGIISFLSAETRGIGLVETDSLQNEE